MKDTTREALPQSADGQFPKRPNHVEPESHAHHAPPTSRANVIELPHYLQPGAPVDKVLGAVKGNGSWLQEQARDRYEEIIQDLAAVRHKYKSASQTHPTSEQAAFDVQVLAGESAEPVWRYAVAHHAQLERAIKLLRPRAMEEYLRRPKPYDAIFGDFLPPDFREEARMRLAQKAYDRGANVTAAEDLEVYEQRRELRRRQPLLGLSTGLPGLDAALGGLRGLTFVGGPAGLGKTTLALNAAVGALRAHPDVAVVFFSLDMPKDVILDRLMCLEAGVTYTALMNDDAGKEAQVRLEAAKERLRDAILPRLRIVESRHLQLDEGELTHAMLLKPRFELLQTTGGKRALQIIDHFGLLPVQNKNLTPLEVDRRRIDLLKNALNVTRTPASPLGDSILIVSEIRKGDSGRSHLAMDDLLGSSRLSYAAEAIVLMEEDDAADTARGSASIVLHVVKGRDGAARRRIKATFDYSRYRFRESSQLPSEGKASGSGSAAKKGTTTSYNQPAHPLAGGRNRGRK